VTKKHFKAIAEVLRPDHGEDVAADDKRRQIAERLADYFKTVNPAFDRARFLAAAEAK
jgi:hypothetical protein